jgi:hypothetical protein
MRGQAGRHDWNWREERPTLSGRAPIATALPARSPAKARQARSRGAPGQSFLSPLAVVHVHRNLRGRDVMQRAEVQSTTSAATSSKPVPDRKRGYNRWAERVAGCAATKEVSTATETGRRAGPVQSHKPAGGKSLGKARCSGAEWRNGAPGTLRW